VEGGTMNHQAWRCLVGLKLLKAAGEDISGVGHM
jgi:hypothetical protein